MDDSSRPALDALLAAARHAQAQAYAPYSRFRVGAALRTPEGEIFAGCNVENASYPVGTCAEAGAIAAMVTGGGRRIAEIVLVGDGEVPVTPCGACRQRLREFGGTDLRVHAASKSKVLQSFRLDELLPYAFGPDNLAPGGRGAG